MQLNGYEKEKLEEYTVEELREIAATYTVIHNYTKSGQSSTSYKRLVKSQLISLIRNNRDYKNANPKSPFLKNIKYANRIRPIIEDLYRMNDPDEMMNLIISVIENSNRGMTPTPGKYYTYIYYAKTPKISYDRYPLILAGNLLPRGFNGFNYHWGKIRQYNTTDEDRLVSGLYEINKNEFELLKSIPYGKIIRNS